MTSGVSKTTNDGRDVGVDALGGGRVGRHRRLGNVTTSRAVLRRACVSGSRRLTGVSGSPLPCG